MAQTSRTSILSHFQKCITCFIIILALFSCSKKNNNTNTNNPQPVGSLSFSIDGTIYTWNEEKDTTSSNYLDMSIYRDSSHTLNAGTNLKPNRPYRLVNLPIPTSTLSANTPFIYINSSSTPNLAVAISTATTSSADPSMDYRAYQGDQVTVTITKIQDNRANGTFSAKLTRGSDAAKVDIIAGKFEKIRIVD